MTAKSNWYRLKEAMKTGLVRDIEDQQCQLNIGIYDYLDGKINLRCMTLNAMTDLEKKQPIGTSRLFSSYMNVNRRPQNEKNNKANRKRPAKTVHH
jgi:hypothetical protein